MLANETKTKYMVFGKETHFSLNLNGKLLEKVRSHKCFGNIISEKRTVTGDIFGGNYDYLCDKARQSTFAILSKVKKSKNTTTVYLLYVSNSCSTDIVVR